MKLHLPARLRSALLACLAVVAPLTGTVATGCLVAGAAAVSLSVAHAAEITVNAGETVAYDSANTYVLNGGTLDVADAYVSTSITIGAAGSTVSLGKNSVLSPLFVTMGNGVTAYNLAGTGTYDLASAANMYGANVSSDAWRGVVSLSNVDVSKNGFNTNNFGNKNSVLKISGMSGWLTPHIQYLPNLLLEDVGEISALKLIDGSTRALYPFFGNVAGNGTFERAGTKFTASMTFAFSGDISGWTGSFLNNNGETSLNFQGAATVINLADITQRAGFDMELKFNGSAATVVNSAIRSDGEGVINMKLENPSGVTFTNEVMVNKLETTNSALTVGAGGRVTVAGDASFNGDITVEEKGMLELSKGATIKNTIVNNGELYIRGTLDVTSAGLIRTAGSESVFTDGKNGKMQSGSVVYVVVRNGVGADWKCSKLVFDGDSQAQLTPEGTVVRQVTTLGSEYWVNEGEVLLDATNQSNYIINGDGATLVLNKTDAAAQGKILADVIGDAGTVKLTKNVSLTGNKSTKSTAALVIAEGATLDLGNGINDASYIDSFSSVTLDNGGINIKAHSGSVRNLKVESGNGTIQFVDFKSPSSGADVKPFTELDAYVFSGVTQLDGILKMQGKAMFAAKFNQLSGGGTLELGGIERESTGTMVWIDSLQGFEGDLIFAHKSYPSANGGYTVKVDSGAGDVNMRGMTLGKGTDQVANRNNIALQLTIEPNRSMTLSEALTMQSNAELNINGASGLVLEKGLIVSGVDNSINILGDSAMDLSGLVVQTGASLGLTGKLSSLAMNQFGSLLMTDVKLTDGATLVYSADASVVRIGKDNLLGAVKVDLNSLANEQSLDFIVDQVLDLGIDSSVSKDLINVVSANIRDAKLDNSGDTWKLVSGVVSQYWEAAGDGSGDWNSSVANWAFRDEATADSTFAGGTDAIFSGHSEATVTITEQVDVQNLEIRSGKYTFENSTGASIVVKNDLVVESEGNLINSDVEVKGALRGEGSVEVKGDISLGASSAIGELVAGGTVTMDGRSPAEDPEKRVADLSVGGRSSAGSLVNVDRLTVSEGASMTVSSETSIGSLAGAGKVEISNAKLTLTDGASSIGSLTTNGLVLDKTAALEVGTLSVPEVTVKLGAAVVAGEKPILNVTSSSSSSIEMTVEVDQLNDLLKLTNGSSVTLASVSEGSVNGTWDITAIKSETGVSEISDNGFSVTQNYRGFGYKLITDDNKTLTLQVTRDSVGWVGENWTSGNAVAWADGEPGDDKAAGFFGSGSSTVTIVGDVSTVLVDVDINKDSDLDSYTFDGGTVTAGSMYIAQGELCIANEMKVTKDAQVYAKGKLTVQEGGVFSVECTFTAEESVAVANAGTFNVETVAIAGEIDNTDGTLKVKGGGSIGTVTGGNVELSDCSLEVGSMNVDTLAISGENAKLSLKGDSVIGTLKGAADVEAATNLTLTESAEGSVNVSVKDTLTLNSGSNVFGRLTVSTIALDLEKGALSDSAAVLTVGSLEKQQEIAAITLGFAADTFDSIPVDDENRIVPSIYKLISGVGSLKSDDFAIAESVATEIARRGATAGFSVEDDALLLSITAVPGGMIWNTAEGWVTNSGYEIPKGEGLYKALDYVEQVLVSDDTTIDLTAPGVGDADDMATIPAAGIIIRNPDGGGTLTLVGDPADDGILPDAATVIAKEEAGVPVTLIGKSMKVNIGLPEGTDGILTSDAAADKVVLAAAEMREGSALSVNRNTEVKGATELREGSSLIVADGAVLSTGKLEGETDATVTGRVNIESVGGIYHGSYGETGAEVEFTSGSYQTLRAGKGLSLRVAGGEGILDLADADAEMSSLGIGSGFSGTAAKGSELVIRNATLNDEADRVEHHTLTLTESENVVSSSELTVSLGAAETAETLGTDEAPVIMDGSVRIDNSDICLKMETTKDNLRALNVNPNAPMIGAKLATLVTNGTVSADNEVEFVGDASLLNVVEKYYTNARLSAEGDVLVDRVTDYYTSKAGGMSETGSVGLEMLDKVLVELNPQTNTQDYQDLANVLNALDDAVVAGNTAEADKLAASVTGASAAALGAALAGDMERQLRAIRNRTTTMGVDQGSVNHNMPYFNAWINAEYDNRKLDEDGTLSGYDYSVTGGTVGFDVDVTPRFVCGLAVSALTGDMSSEGPDELEADVDSYYLTAFARTTYRRWTHTFVASVGKSDLSIDRTVSFSGGNYRTKGETDAMNFGFMYELGYVFALDADATTCLQPVFNVSVAHSSMDGYTESGSDAALEIGSVDMTTVTIGMGARLQSVVGQNIFNRASIFESRALIKVNAGDRDAEVDTALAALPTASGKVSSAERGPISLEIGAGITVPVGSHSGSIFLDGSAELGSEYTGVNATVGYRLNF